TYTYPIRVKVAEGAAQYALQNAPEGMRLKDGVLSWDVPADWPAKTTEVTVSVRDAAGRELLHTFRVVHPGEAPPAAAAAGRARGGGSCRRCRRCCPCRRRPWTKR